MTHDVLLLPDANELLNKLDKAVSERIRSKLRELSKFPERGKHLKYSDYWSLRIGDYRAIYEIWNKERKIVVLFIGHRKDVYDDFSKLF